jgi:hypothetical protein
MKLQAWGAVLALALVAAPAQSEEGGGVGSPEEAAQVATVERAVERFQQKDYRRALPLLLASHAAHPADLDLTLLLGITLFRLHEEERAEPLLRSAAASDNPETAASAHIFLGLLLRDAGASDLAEYHLRRVAKGGPLSSSGAALLRQVRQPPFALILILRPEFDSNVPLLPTAPTATSSGGPHADGDLLALVSLAFHPFASLGLTLEQVASYRQQFTLAEFSLFSSTTGARYSFFGRSDRVALGYHFEVLTLGGALLDFGHVVSAEYRRKIVRELGIGAGYTFRYRSYDPMGYQAFTGPTHTGLLELSWGTAERRLEFGAGYLVTREETADPSFANLGQGAAFRARTRFGRFELAWNASAIARVFDALDPIYGALYGERRDTQLFADLGFSVDLSRHLGLVLGGSVLRNFSTIPEFDYLKGTAHLGLVFGYAGP